MCHLSKTVKKTDFLAITVAICHNVLMSFMSYSYMFSPPGGATMWMNKMAAMTQKDFVISHLKC